MSWIRWSVKRMVLTSLVVGAALNPPAAAQAGDSLRLTVPDYLLQEAAMNNPELRSSYMKYRAALEQVPQKGALPDPELAFGWFVSPIETRLGPQQARVGLTQMFPWFGTLGAQEEAAARRAQAVFQTFREQRNRLIHRVEKAWLDVYEVEQSIDILEQHVEILESFESLALRRYEAATGSQVDVLRVQIERKDAEVRLDNLRDTRSVKRNAFAELLDREAPTVAWSSMADTLTGRTLKKTGDELRRATLQNNPELEKLSWSEKAAEADVEAARRNGMPRFGVGLDYIVTGERDMALSENGRDAMLARAAIQIPLFRGKYRAQTNQARLQVQSIRSEARAAENRLMTQMEEALRDYHDSDRRLDLYETRQIRRTQQAIDILVSDYSTDSSAFEEILRMQRMLLNYKLEREKAVVDQRTACSYIDYLTGRFNKLGNTPDAEDFDQ